MLLDKKKILEIEVKGKVFDVIPDTWEKINYKYDKETEEIKIISVYLPEQLPVEEIEEIIKTAISEIGASTLSDMGKVMGLVMPQVRGRADGKIVNTIVTEKLRAL